MANQSYRFGAGVLAAAIACTFAAPAFAAPKDTAPTDRFIVKFKDGSAEHGNGAARRRAIEAAGNDQGLHLGKTRRLAAGADLVITDRKLDLKGQQAFLRKLARDPHVEYVQVDRRMVKLLTPNDTRYSEQWHYSDPVSSIRANTAWNTATGTGIVVAVIDTGITDHVDLSANIIAGYDFISDAATGNDGDGRDSDPHDPGDWVAAEECGAGSSASDSSWHGTHVAGTVAALTNNALGVAGVAFNAKVQPVRTLGKCGGYTSDIADAIIWASGGTVAGVPANPTPADVINMSLGGSGACDPLYQASIDMAIASGAVVVVSAGNSNAPAANYRPANCPGVITVAATGRTGARASYSNYGPAVEIAAPGGDGTQRIASTLNAGTTVPGAENYGLYNGTSMAAPHVAGVVALVKEVDGTLSPEAISALLQATARPLPVACAQGCGAGLLDANAAVITAGTPLMYLADPASVAETDSGDHVVTWTVQLSKPLATDTTFDFATADGTATAGSDYDAVALTGQVIAAGDTSKTFAVTVHGDADYEQGETILANLDNVSTTATLLDDSGSTVVANDDTLVLQNAIPVAGLADAFVGSNGYFTLQVPTGASNLKFTLAGGTGDADLYVRFGSAPTLGTFTCRSWNFGNTETCNMTAQAGTWHGMLNTYEPYAGTTLTGSYQVPVDLSVGDVSTSEGDAGTKVVTFTVSLSQSTAIATTYDISTAADTATSDDDFASASATGESIPAGALSKTFAVTVNGDTAIEDDEAFFVNLANASANGTITDGQGTGTITNDDVPSLSIDDVTTNEGDSGTNLQTFTISLSEAAVTAVTFDIATTGGTATSDVDFASKISTGVNIAAGDTSATFSVDLNGDTDIEDDEAYTVDITNVAGATVADASGAGTITNDDYPTLTIDDATAVTEGDSGTKVLTFTATLSQAVNFSVGFDVATNTGGTATSGTDFDPASATGETIPAGQTSKTFSVTINGDTDIEADETVQVDISNAANATITDSQASGTITNDDFPSLSIDDQSSAEGDSGTTQHTFTVSLSTAALTDVTFDIGTTGGSATADDDFASNSATGVTIAAGNTSSTFSVDVNGDTAIEGDEGYTVDVSNVVGATVGDGSGAGTITNDDFPTISIADAAAVIEGNSGTKQMVFTVNLSAASAFPVSYDIATANGTASSANDYVAASATGVTIPAGQTSKTFNVTINGDGRMERSETVLVNISNASGGSITDGQASGTITNDDGTMFISDVSVTEGDSGTKTMSFLVQLTQASTAPVIYNVRTVSGNSTATAGVDFVGNQLIGEVMAAGQTSKVFAVTIKGDTGIEPNETIHAAIVSTAVDISNASAYGTILNDDGAAKLSIADAAFVEGNSGTKTLNFTVSLSSVMPTPVTFNIFTVDGMAVAGSDFEGKSLVGETIPAGTLTKTFSITTYGDTQIEGNETLFVRINNANVAVLDGQARGVLVNDDGPVLSISDATIVEGDSGNKTMLFTVSISQLATAKVTFNFSTAPVTASGGSDFDPVSLTGVTIPYGQLSRMVAVTIRGDTTVEPDETLRGNISLGNVSILDGVGIGTIVNDDPAP